MSRLRWPREQRTALPAADTCRWAAARLEATKETVGVALVWRTSDTAGCRMGLAVMDDDETARSRYACARQDSRKAVGRCSTSGGVVSSSGVRNTECGSTDGVVGNLQGALARRLGRRPTSTTSIKGSLKMGRMPSDPRSMRPGFYDTVAAWPALCDPSSATLTYVLGTPVRSRVVVTRRRTDAPRRQATQRGRVGERPRTFWGEQLGL